MTLANFNKSVEEAVRRQDGVKLAKLMRMNSPEAAQAGHIFLVDGGSCPRSSSEPWALLPVIVEKRFVAAAAIVAVNWVEAYASFTEALLEYLNILQSDTAWSIPLLHAWCADVRVLAEEADKQLEEEGRKGDKTEDVERTLKRAFAVTNGDRNAVPEESKRVGTLGVINELFRVYFKLNAVRLCQHLIRTVNAPGFLDFEKSFPIGQRVTYKFFAGRMHLYEDRYKDAVVDLTYAADRMPVAGELNKRRILLYLIPARILGGSLPTQAMLRRYKMIWYVDIARALQTGNMSLFERAFRQHERMFIRKGLYLAIEKMRSIVYRSLLGKLHRTRVGMSLEDPHKINLEDFQFSLRLCGKTMSKDEVECILANLIYRGFVKGYLSHRLGFLVLSTKNPFPALSSIGWGR